MVVFCKEDSRRLPQLMTPERPIVHLRQTLLSFMILMSLLNRQVRQDGLEPQLIPKPMSDGDDFQPAQEKTTGTVQLT